ncbi:cytidine deaminase [Pseudoroseicyclus tamaricis]|uniref:Cytidine deaminase n=1 Tax=Pseudoroseicyclus tamaricis TaxID=2705421 RepID=A0A6B2JT00_9RHOB|nr:cytidine deaminase [Pseudoroseicyclus tamaricis]NDV01155.1 cytidine deaminase [Pseudoroseicyclus tamaricis]
MALADSPFPRDTARAEALAARDGEAIRAAAEAALSPGALLGAEAVERLVARFDLADAEELILHLLPLAEKLADPPISGFFVGAAGLATTGEVILGGNLEWPGAHLGMTLHGEGFVAIRAFHLGLSLKALAISEAHPCAHCRQCLAEYAAADDMVLVDPHGHRLTLAELYPWPFSPAALGAPGASPDAPPLSITIAGSAPPQVEALLRSDAGRAHAPYSGCPAALVLETAGEPVLGLAIESVAFNPTIQPVMSALVNLHAAGIAPSEIRAAWLLQRGGAVDYAAPTRALLKTLAPEAPLTLLGWPA